MNIPNQLSEILRIRRPAGGNGVKAVKQLIANAIVDSGNTYQEDIDGNIICTTTFNHVLFSCHTDTVHHGEGFNEIRVDDFGIVTAWEKFVDCDHNGTQEKMRRSILGADDGIGIHIMLEMIKADIDGTYVFHADEEIGCIGSRSLSENAYSIDGYDLEEDFTHAIAFDRKGTSDVIYEQLGEEMCSPDCRIELQDRLNFATQFSYRPAIGVVTDTAMYADEVEECINLSVGYYAEHTTHERLDLGHALALLDHILVNPSLFEDLPVMRVPMSEDNFDQAIRDDYNIVRPDTVSKLCHDHPQAISQLLETLGYDYIELFDILNHEELID